MAKTTFIHIEGEDFESRLLIAMVQELMADLRGDGYVGNNELPPDDSKTKLERRIIAREALRAGALDYVNNSADFERWSDVLDVPPQVLRERLLDSYEKGRPSATP